MANKHGNRVVANFTEEVVGFALESYLSLISFPVQRFSIEPFSQADERWLGADARLHSSIRGFLPFYMQFKRPSAYPDFSTSKIIKGRKSLKLDIDPHALYFELRNKQPHHSDFQHNVLFKLRNWLRQTGLGDAAYVCPLFLERSNYRTSLHWSGVWNWARFRGHIPWELEQILIADAGRSIKFDRIPVISEHISIPPHKIVTSAKHSYSFTEAGTGLCFHSPEALPEGVDRLDKFLSKIAARFLDRTDKINRDQANQQLRELVAAVFGSEPGSKVPQFGEIDDPIGQWLAWGDFLSSEYGIEQYAFVRWDDSFPRFLF